MALNAVAGGGGVFVLPDALEAKSSTHHSGGTGQLVQSLRCVAVPIIVSAVFALPSERAHDFAGLLDRRSCKATFGNLHDLILEFGREAGLD